MLNTHIIYLGKRTTLISLNQTTKKLIKMDMTWKLTDYDNAQYGRQIDAFIYQFREFDREMFSLDFETYQQQSEYIDKVFDNSEMWIEETIDLKDYSNEEIQGFISPYGYNLINIDELYGSDANFIIAECIFEQTNGLY